MRVKSIIDIDINIETRTATVNGASSEKYARKLLQDKLKTDTPYAGGWNCFLTNRLKADEGLEPWNFELSNIFAYLGGYIGNL
jgi:hypothetical protein